MITSLWDDTVFWTTVKLSKISSKNSCFTVGYLRSLAALKDNLNQATESRDPTLEFRPRTGGRKVILLNTRTHALK